jgi:hypothetical protein
MIETLIWLSLIAVLIIQLWGLFRKKTLSKKQLTVKLLLNVLLWVVLLLLVIQPKWKNKENANAILVYSSSSKKEDIAKIQDSLKIGRSISYGQFKQKWTNFIDRKIHFLGQDAEPELLSNLVGQAVSWTPELKGIQKIHWDGVLRRGELQTVAGKIITEEPSTLKIQYAQQTLDSVRLQKGFNAFELKFPVVVEGRNEVSLVLGQTEIQKIHFYAKAAPSISVLMLLDYPDFESKALSEWLGIQGYKAQIFTEVAKSTLHQNVVNVAERNFSPHLLITSPSKASDSRVKKAVLESKSVLFMEPSEVISDILKINRSLGTKFSLKRTSTDETVSVGKELTAWPYAFTPQSNQRLISALPIAYQKKTGQVALSLLSETFPLKLSGDSVQYNRIWAETLSPFFPSDTNAVLIEAPIFKDVHTHLLSYSDNLFLEQDTLSLSSSMVNANKKLGSYVFRETGWQKLNDSLEVYVEEYNPKAYLEHWVKGNDSSSIKPGEETRTLPDWIWFMLIILCLTALWIEPKFNY